MVIGSIAMKRWILVVVAIAACGNPDPKKDKPAAPDSNDPAFAIKGLNPWYVVADVAQPGTNDLAIVVTPPGGTDFVDAYVADLPVQRMGQQNDGFGLETSIESLPPGSYDILFSRNGSNTAFAKVSFNRSAPYYVLVSTDYDFSDPSDSSTSYMDTLHASHPGMRITHFWAPYTYTDPVVTEDRRAALTSWILDKRDTFHDEIGLHIHPYCNFVTDAGVTCVTDNSTEFPAGDTSGYTIKLNSYDTPTLTTLLQHARDLFTARGLNSPITFRAGGWTADLSSFQALNNLGFVADSSALNWAKIEEWQGYELYTWNMEHWGPIDDTSQPYYPSDTDVLASTPGSDMAMLEVPDNGVMIDYVTSLEMTSLFNENWDGSVLETPHVLMMGFHPSSSLTSVEKKKVDDLLVLADQHLGATGSGPVVYITLSELAPVFPAQ
jgi:hypothetical protein